MSYVSNARKPLVKVKPPTHRMLTLTVAALPLSYVPHELIRSGPSLTGVVFALVLICGVRDRKLMPLPGAVELIAGTFATYIAIRMLLLAPVEGREFQPVEAFTAVGAIIAGIILLRLGRSEELRSAVMRGLKLMVIALLLIEAYQVLAGLPWLFSLGYQEGFYYYTQSGEYRPFATFLSPTVFGGYLAMVGIFVYLASEGKRSLLWLLAVAAGLVLTDTRAAWLAFAAAFILVFLAHSQKVRQRILLASVPTIWIGAIVLLGWPDLLASFWERLSSIFESDLTSNSSRLILWEGTLEASAESPIIGYGPSPYLENLWPIIGDVARLGHAHNNYLQILFIYGWLGVVLFLVFMIASSVTLLRSLRSHSLAIAGLGALTVFAVDSLFETTWTSLSVVTTLFLLIGLGSGSRTDDNRLPSGSTRGVTIKPVVR